MTMTIPERFKATLKQLVALDSGTLEALAKAMDAAEPTLDEDRDCASISTAVNAQYSEVNGYLQLFASLAAFRKAERTELSHFIASLIAAMRESGDPGLVPPNEVDFAAILQSALSARSGVAMSNRAMAAASDRDRTLDFAEVLTDIRPVFCDEDTASESSVILHTLRLSYWRYAKRKTIYLALDSKDIVRLQSVLDQALEREALLVAAIGEVPVLIPVRER